MFQKQLSVSNSRWLFGSDVLLSRFSEGWAHSVCLDMGAISSNTPALPPLRLPLWFPSLPSWRLDIWLRGRKLSSKQLKGNLEYLTAEIGGRGGGRSPSHESDKGSAATVNTLRKWKRWTIVVWRHNIPVVYSIQFAPVFNVIPPTFHGALRPR